MVEKPRNAIEAARADMRWSDDDCVTPEPTDAVPGTAPKIETLCGRVERGECLWCENDHDRPLVNRDDVNTWIHRDLEESRRYRLWRLHQPLLVRVDEFGCGREAYGVWLYVDQISLQGCAMSVYLRDRAEWMAFDEVRSPMDSTEVQTLLAIVGGCPELAEELTA